LLVHASGSCLEAFSSRNDNAENGVYLIDQENAPFPVWCDFQSDSSNVITYLHPIHFNVVTNVNALYDVRSEVVIRHLQTTGKQFVARIEQLNTFWDVDLSVQINAYQNYTSTKYGDMGSYIYLGMVPAGRIYKDVVQGWQVEGEDHSFENCDTNFNSYFVLETNKTGNNEYHRAPCSYYDTKPLMNSWKTKVNLTKVYYFMKII